MLQGAGQEQRESWEDCGSDSEMPEQRQGREGWPGGRTDMAQDVGPPAADEQQSTARGALPLQLPMPCCCPSLPWTTWLPLRRILQSRKITSERVPTAFRAADRKPIKCPTWTERHTLPGAGNAGTPWAAQTQRQDSCGSLASRQIAERAPNQCGVIGLRWQLGHMVTYT